LLIIIVFLQSAEPGVLSLSRTLYQYFGAVPIHSVNKFSANFINQASLVMFYRYVFNWNDTLMVLFFSSPRKPLQYF
jgi:hypothetical protein